MLWRRRPPRHVETHGGLREQFAKGFGFLLERPVHAGEVRLDFFHGAVQGLPLRVGEVDGVGIPHDEVGREKISAGWIAGKKNSCPPTAFISSRMMLEIFSTERCASGRYE